MQVMSKDDGKSRGFGFVAFEDPEAAERAVEDLAGKELVEGKVSYVYLIHFRVWWIPLKGSQSRLGSIGTAALQHFCIHLKCIILCKEKNKRCEIPYLMRFLVRIRILCLCFTALETVFKIKTN